MHEFRILKNVFIDLLLQLLKKFIRLPKFIFDNPKFNSISRKLSMKIVFSNTFNK